MVNWSQERIDDELAGMPPQERRVLQLRLGLKDGRSRTREEVGREFGKTGEEIRQIEARGLGKIRDATLRTEFADHLNTSAL